MTHVAAAPGDLDSLVSGEVWVEVFTPQGEYVVGAGKVAAVYYEPVMVLDDGSGRQVVFPASLPRRELRVTALEANVPPGVELPPGRGRPLPFGAVRDAAGENEQ